MDRITTAATGDGMNRVMNFGLMMGLKMGLMAGPMVTLTAPQAKAASIDMINHALSTSLQENAALKQGDDADRNLAGDRSNRMPVELHVDAGNIGRETPDTITAAATAPLQDDFDGAQLGVASQKVEGPARR